ncbi:overproduction-induced pheromone-resistant [Vermiconidia calcicola]|uniref:Overproduction-induced pheromone-resistant n=1 Tax=Vermiconidia calcicola TaxID=1690605 RepID=A0ACC3MG06_9PEZI|nr:overproduction-induced pheromone-resistant [Vermiconidia calcicola]
MAITSRHVENTLRTIFKRCVQCPPTAPTCPTCVDGEICSLVPEDCRTCAHMMCMKNPSQVPVSKGPNVGAIAGGVVGGVAFVALLVFLIYWFWIRKRRQQQDAELEEEWANDEVSSQKRNTHYTAMHDTASTRTRGSLANSILSRASNIIQIAYIPGVTNRNGGSGRTSVHAPVPPIPAAHRSQPPKSPLSNEGDALFFRPGDLRDSTWSGTSSINSDKRDTRYDKRDTQYTMASISPSLMRDSVGSEIIMDDASAAPMPATAATRLAPRMVSVKSSTSSNSLSGSSMSPPTPPEESSGGKVKTLQVMMPGQGNSSLSPQPSIRSAGKAKQVTVGGKGRFPIRQVSAASTTSSQHAPAVSSPLAGGRNGDTISPSAIKETDENSKAVEHNGLISNTDFATPTAQPQESPFFDASEYPGSSKPNPYASMSATVDTSRDSMMKRGGKGMGGLSAVLEEAAKRASMTSQDWKSEGEGPFSDKHSIN